MSENKIIEEEEEKTFDFADLITQQYELEKNVSTHPSLQNKGKIHDDGNVVKHIKREISKSRSQERKDKSAKDKLKQGIKSELQTNKDRKASRNKSKDVFERLHSDSKVKNITMEHYREANEKSQNTGKPEINKVSQKLASRQSSLSSEKHQRASSLSVFDRLTSDGKKRKNEIVDEQLKQLEKTLPSVTISLQKKSQQLVDNKMKRKISQAIDLVKYQSVSINESELKLIFQNLELYEGESAGLLELKIKNKLNFDREKYSGTKESLVLINELSNIIYQNKTEIDRADLESLLFNLLSTLPKEVKKQNIQQTLLKVNYKLQVTKIKQKFQNKSPVRTVRAQPRDYQQEYIESEFSFTPVKPQEKNMKRNSSAGTLGWKKTVKRKLVQDNYDETVVSDDDDISPLKSIQKNPIKEQANAIAESLRHSLAMRESGKDFTFRESRGVKDSFGKTTNSDLTQFEVSDLSQTEKVKMKQKAKVDQKKTRKARSPVPFLPKSYERAVQKMRSNLQMKEDQKQLYANIGRPKVLQKIHNKRSQDNLDDPTLRYIVQIEINHDQQV